MMSAEKLIRDTIEALLAGHTLTLPQARELLEQVANDRVNPAQLAALFAIYRFRYPTIEEVEGFRSAMLNACTTVDLSEYDPVDLCGTGGDGKDTFNISTASAFVVAACGIKVAKHGNYSFSSTSGSSNVLEKLGVALRADPTYLRHSIETSGVCFIHAPLFHQAFKGVQATRKELGIRTFLNLLGPLVNPARPLRQVVGVFNLEVSRLYRNVLQRTGTDFRIVHSLDGYDELSLTGWMRITSKDRIEDVAAKDLGLESVSPQDIIAPPDIGACATLLESVLSGTSTQAQQNVVIANSAVAVRIYRPTLSLAECTEIAREAIRSGAALRCLSAAREIAVSG